MIRKLLLSAAATVGMVSGAQAATVDVDLELALLVDVSSSVTATDFDTQRQGYANAFRTSGVQDAILNKGSLGRIAATVVYWAGADQQSQVVDWFLLDSAQSIENFATQIENASRPFGCLIGNCLTGTDSAINAIVEGAAEINATFASNDFQGTRNVIDTSGDGNTNTRQDFNADNAATAAARDNAVAKGVVINGLPIQPVGAGSGLLDWYKAWVIGGQNSFAIQASGYAGVQAALEKKLVSEITPPPPPVPLPAGVPLLLTGLVAFGGLRFLQRRKAA
mgnify:CR=1 FL=1